MAENKSKCISDFLKPKKTPPEESAVFEELPPDFDDGWTQKDLIAVADKILAKLEAKGEVYKKCY